MQNPKSVYITLYRQINSKVKGFRICESLQLVEKVFFDKLADFEKHTQTRKESPQAYRGTVGDS